MNERIEQWRHKKRKKQWKKNRKKMRKIEIDFEDKNVKIKVLNP